MNTIVKKASMADLIAAAFYRVGYHPHESLVTVGMAGPRNRMGVVARMDLPSARDRRAVVGAELRAIRRAGDQQVVVLVVSDQTPDQSDGGPVRLPHRALVREIRRQAPRFGCRVLDVIAVNSARWRSYLCPDLACCPADGYSLSEALTGPLAAHLVAAGLVLAANEAALVADVDPQGPSLPERSPGAQPLVRLAPDDAQAALDRWRELLNRPESAGAGDLGWLMEVLQDRWLRDSMLLTLIPGSGSVPDAMLIAADPAALDELFAADPDHDLIERGRVLLAGVARTAPPGRRADALALLAWAAWWAGQGARGRLLVRRALDDVPTHKLAMLVDQMLMLGIAPGWVERLRESSGVSAEFPG